MKISTPTMKDVWRSIEAGAYTAGERARYGEEGRLEAEFRADLATAIGSEAWAPPWVAVSLSDLAWRERRGDFARVWDLADDIIAALTTEEPAQ